MCLCRQGSAAAAPAAQHFGILLLVTDCRMRCQLHTAKQNKTRSQVPAPAALPPPVKGVVLLVKRVAVHVGVLNMPSTVVAQACSDGRAGGGEREKWPVWARRRQTQQHPATTAAAASRVAAAAASRHSGSSPAEVRSFWLWCRGPTTGACICSTGRLYITRREEAAAHSRTSGAGRAFFGATD